MPTLTRRRSADTHRESWTLNGPMLFEFNATPAEYKAGLDRAIANGWLVLHESGTFVRFTQAGADLFA
jgi:hypothetical protein